MRKAPDFTLLDQDGNSFTLSENLGKKILLVFYPKDNSLVCTKQLCSYNENFNLFLDKGILVIGISTDSVESHKEFHTKNNLKFTLLSDSEKKVSKAYNSVGIFGMSQRKLLLISETGEILDENYSIPILYRNSDFLFSKLIKKFIDLTFITIIG